MSKLNELQCKRINDLNLVNTPKTTISSMLHCSRTAVYYQLEKINPRDGSVGTLQRRPRRCGKYKLTEQVKSNILEYVLIHKFATHAEIIRDLNLDIKSISTISYCLKEMGIGTYTAKLKQYLGRVNMAKR